MFFILFLFFPFANNVINALSIPQDGVCVPILMYHSILKDKQKIGDYIMTPERFEQDLIYIKEKGYTTITITDLINYCEKPDAELPKNPIILTLDDGYYNNYVYVYPLMKKYNMKCVISVIGIFSDENIEGEKMSPNYSHLTWDQMKEMSNSGYVEIQNHSYNMHTYDNGRKGSIKKIGESSDIYTKLFTEDVLYLQNILKEKAGIIPNTYAYPYGRISKESIPTLKTLGFKATLSCCEGKNYITKNSSLTRLKRYNRPGKKSTYSFFQKVHI
jgi:peptidoglycan/xylan/chitin deacetylase (PgdA/CDA1 family)